MSQTTLPERVLEWTKTYCDSLTENYKQHSVRMYQGSDSDYSKQQLENVNNGTANLTNFVRFDMRIINQRERLHDPTFTGWAGGYLYLR